MSYLRPVLPRGGQFFPDPNVRWLGNVIKPWDGKSRIWMGIIGIPFDGGTVSHRRGSRTAPSHIRDNLYSKTTYMVDHDTEIAPERVYDCGDVEVVITDFDETMRRLATAAGTVFERAEHVVSFGGDHSSTYELIKAARAHANGDIGLIQFDAHHDTRTKWGEHSGFWLRQLLDERILDARNILQIGLRGSLYSRDYMKYLRDNQIRFITAWDLHQDGLEAVVEQTVQQLSSTKEVYISFDIDAIDQAFAPGTDYPSTGGLTSHEAIYLIYELTSRINTRWLDIMEVSPPLDVADQTVRVASELAAQYIHALTKRSQI